MTQAHIFISGFVQGVGYRAFVKRTAGKLGLKGIVRNLSDRRVEVIVQGDKDKIIQLANKCERGPFFAEVKNVTVDWEDVNEQYQDFKIVRD